MKRIILSFALLICAFTAQAATNPDKDLLEGIRSGNIELVENALKNGANPNVISDVDHYTYLQRLRRMNNDGETPLHLAARHGHTEAIFLLLQYGANPKAINKYGCTPLQYASSRGLTEAMSLLLKNGANPNAIDKGGNTPLHCAALYGHTEAVSLLLKNGANPNAIDKYGETPLHWIAELYNIGYHRSAAYLLSHGADPYLLNNDGETAYNIAIKHNNHSVAALIKSFMK